MVLPAPARAAVADPPAPLSPEGGASFTAGANIKFRASASAAVDSMRFYVSRDTAQDSNGVLSNWIDSVKGDPVSGEPGVYEGAPSSTQAWPNIAGTYYWQPVYIECSGPGDCFIEGEIRSLEITAPPPGSAPNTFFTRHPPHRTHRRTVTFAFASNVKGAVFQCFYAKEGWTRCPSPQTFKHLEPGRYQFKVRAIANGKKDLTPARWQFRVRP